MAPFNLSDLAVKEIKLPKSSLGPQVSKNHNGRFLMGLFFDFWNIFSLNFMVATLFQAAVKLHLTTSSLHKVWSMTDLTLLNTLSWSSVAIMYFFTSFYLNNGQTAGMHFMKCRISMKEHDAASAFRWSMMSLSLFFTLGLAYLMIRKLPKAWGEISAHDHLWQELITQKEMAAPDVRTLVKDEEIKDEELWKVA